MLFKTFPFAGSADREWAPTGQAALGHAAISGDYPEEEIPGNT